MSGVAERPPIPATLPPPAPLPGQADPDLVDHRVRLHGVPWRAYERLLAVRGAASVPRLTDLDGELELLSPCIHHEAWKAGRFAFFALPVQGCRKVACSRFLPELDPRLPEDCMAAPNQRAARRLLRERLGPAGVGGT